MNQEIVLDILSKNPDGMKPLPFCKEVRSRGIKNPLSVARSLVKKGLVRIDKGKKGQCVLIIASL